MSELERCWLAKEKGYTYNQYTGEIRSGLGKVITANGAGYLRCVVRDSNKSYVIRAHRLAWYLHYGNLPKGIIDHVDGNGFNNKIRNLRDVNRQQNMFNKKCKGYTWHKRAKKFWAQIRVDGKTISLGLFENESDARKAYLDAKAKYHIIPRRPTKKEHELLQLSFNTL